VKRRQFITLIGGAAAWPLAAHAQQGERMRRVGVLLPASPDDIEFQARVGAFLQELQQLGWRIGRNVRIEVRWASSEASNIRKHASELAAAGPDAILAHGASTVGPMLQATRNLPIVFPAVSDPVGAGFVESLARPGGNATGFMTYEYSIGAKWLQLLKEIAPRITRTAVIRDLTDGVGLALYGAVQSIASQLGVELTPVNVRNTTEIERAITMLVQSANAGLVVPGSAFAIVHRDLLVTLSARHRLPAIYWDRAPVAAGGLMSYGPDFVEQYRQAASYVHRILKGERPADLPVQAPTKYELVINLKTAKALGLEVPPTLLALADEVIE
jgi:putative ABC transport system substrate-binding protein